MAGQPQMIEPQTAASRADRLRPPVNEWDGRMRSYIPGPTLRVSSNLKLHTEEAESIHPVTFEVIRVTRLWISRQIRSRPILSAGLLVAGDHCLVSSTSTTSIQEPKSATVWCSRRISNISRDGGPGRALDD